MRETVALTVLCVAVTAVVLVAADHGQAGLWQDAGRAIALPVLAGGWRVLRRTVDA
jgi:hypothetical protein